MKTYIGQWKKYPVSGTITAAVVASMLAALGYWLHLTGGQVWGG